MVGAAAVTVIAAVPVCPSLVAVMVTGPPAVTPVTSPLDETVAMDALLVVHVTVRPVSTFPAASVVVAVNCTVAPTFTVAVPGLTDTDVTGAAVAVTVIAAVPLCPSLVAVIVTGPPAVTPVTSPVDETVATAALLVVHVTVRPVSTFPAASCVVAVSCTVAPTATAAGVGVTVTDATGAGAVTVIAAVPLCPSLVAVIVAVPAVTPVTSPVPDTVATPGALLAHVTVRPVSTFAAASFVVAVNCTVCPTTTAAGVGVTVTDATGVVTVIAAVPVFPSLVAVIVAVPAAAPVTRPAAFTVATVVLLLVHVTVRPVSTFPAASFVVAVSCTVAPTATAAGAGVTVTDATGVGGVVVSLPQAASTSTLAPRSRVARPLTLVSRIMRTSWVRVLLCRISGGVHFSARPRRLLILRREGRGATL